MHPKPANWCIDTLHKQLSVLQYFMRYSLTILSRIDRHPTTHLTAQVLEHRAYTSLQRLLFVALLAVAAARRGILRREIEKEGEVGLREADVGGAAPGEGQTLGGGEGDAGKSVAVAEDEGAAG